MSTIPYLSQGIGVPIDPATGMPKKKKQPAFTQGQVQSSLAQNPLGTFGPSPGVNYTRPGQVSVPGFTPDYKTLIANALGPLQAQLGAEGVSDLTGRDNQFVRALGQFGQQFDLGQANEAFGPEFVNQAGLGNLLPQANALAAQTTGAGLSFKARSEKAHKDTVRQIRNALAARGLLRSGELGHQLQEAQTGFETGQYDATQQLQDFLGAVNKGYADAQRQRQMQLEAATRQEAGNQAALNPASGSQQARLNPETGLYVGPDGRTYNQAGVPVNAPVASPDLSARSPLPPGWIGNPEPLDMNAILGTVKPPDPRTLKLPGGGGTLRSYGI